MNQAVAEVGQYSRESGRVPVHVLHERLEAERDQLRAEKKKAESALAALSSEKSERLSEVYRRRMPKSDAIAATNQIQSDYNRKRSKLLGDVGAIEERLNDIKGRLSGRENVREDVKVLLRIEGLLERILEKLAST